MVGVQAANKPAAGLPKTLPEGACETCGIVHAPLAKEGVKATLAVDGELIDPNNYPRMADIGNNCRFSAFMAGTMPFQVMYKDTPWREMLAHFKGRLDDSVREGYLARELKGAVRDGIDGVMKELGDESQVDLLLMPRENWPGDLEGASEALRQLGVFQAFHHVPNTDKADIEIFLKPLDESGGGFFEVLGQNSFKDFLTQPARDELMKEAVEKGKSLGIIQVHYSDPFREGEIVFPERHTGTYSARKREELARVQYASLAGTGSKIIERPSPGAIPNNSCCVQGACQTGHPNKYCQSTSSGCSIYSDQC